jgi:TetR/AcrR family transcriptional regulator, lmrAB and yxaGH operons repressor
VADDSRTLMIRAAARLFQERGYAATSFHDVIARSGAPRGSIYHHFPGGKEQLAAEALQWYAHRIRGELARKEPADTVEAIEGFLQIYRESLRRTDFRVGCPLAGVALDLQPEDERLQEVLRSGLGDWQRVMIKSLERDGLPSAQARRVASFVIATVEGALLLARIERSLRPMDDITAELTAYVRSRIPSPRSSPATNS